MKQYINFSIELTTDDEKIKAVYNDFKCKYKKFLIDEDMELYEKLEHEALNGGSLASVAKARIKSSYETATDSDLKEQIVEVIQDEMQKFSMKMVGALLAGVEYLQKIS